MRIGIISDTHDHHRNVSRAIDILDSHDVRYVLHAGDIVTAPTARAFAERWRERFIAVLGNCDADPLSLQETAERFGAHIHEPCYEGVLDGTSIYMVHTPDTVAKAASSQKYDLVIYGHTHRPDVHREGKTLIVNPGTARNWITGAGRVTLLDLADMTYTSERLG